MIDVTVNKALLDEIDGMIAEMTLELKDAEISDKTYTREEVNPEKLDTMDLSFARDDIAKVYNEQFKLLSEIRRRHSWDTWKNFKIFKVAGLTEQKTLKERQAAFKSAFIKARPNLIFKLKAGTDGAKRKK